MTKRTECKYCGNKIMYTAFDSIVKCYKCLTIHCIDAKKIEPIENMIYSMFPCEEREHYKKGIKFEHKKNKPAHNIHTV